MHSRSVRTTFFVLLLTLFTATALGALARAQDGAPTANGDAAPAATGASAAAQIEALKAEGEEIYYRDCYECHTDGGMGPTLNGRTLLNDSARVLKILTQGGSDMPEFRTTLNDREIAAVATYVRNAWDNRYGIVLETEAARARAVAEGN